MLHLHCPEKKRQLNGYNVKISPQIKRRLYLSFALGKQLKSSIQQTKPWTKARQIVTKAVGTKLLRKYRVQRQLTSIVSYLCSKKILMVILFMTENTFYNQSQRSFSNRKFFLNDQVSRIMRGKKDYVKRGEQ